MVDSSSLASLAAFALLGSDEDMGVYQCKNSEIMFWQDLDGFNKGKTR